MKWYTKYLQLYGKPLCETPMELIEDIRQKIAAKSSSTPLASVVIIAHNEENHILSCLWSLIDNVCDIPLEIIVINNNSTDNTEKILKLLHVNYYNEYQKGPGYARQCGLNHAKGRYHLCIDSDTLYPKYYIKTHLNALMKPNVACTYSLWGFIPDKKHTPMALFIYESLRNIYLKLQAINRPELCVRGMSFSFITEYGKEIGFRKDIIRGEDGSLALALKPYGKLKFLTSSKAKVMTSNSTLNSEGSLIKNLGNRIQKLFNNGFSILKKKEHYKDNDQNLIK